MSVDPYAKLASHHKLSKTEERAVIHAIAKGGDWGSVDKVVTDLRTNSDALRDQSIKEMFQVVEDFKHLKVIDATRGIDTMCVTQIKAAESTAQANRIENEAKRAVAEMSAPMPRQPVDLKAIMPNQTKYPHFNPPSSNPGSWC